MCRPIDAAVAASVPLKLVDLGSLSGLRGRYGADLLLVRPDQHVAWRGTDVDDPASLLRHVVGAVTPNIAAPAPSPLEEIAR